MKKVYTSINLGRDTIKFVVGELYNNKINLLSSYEITSKGIRKGLIVDANLVINSIKDGIKEINKHLAIDIKKVLHRNHIDILQDTLQYQIHVTLDLSH